MVGNARKELEAKSGRKVVSRENDLFLIQSKKQAKNLEDEKVAAVAKETHNKTEIHLIKAPVFEYEKLNVLE